MRMTLHLTDEAWDRLGGNQQEVQSQITKRLALMPAPIVGNDRSLILTGDDRRTLETILSRPLGTAQDLIFVVQALAVLKIGVIERQLTTSEASRIDAYAKSMSLPLPQAAKELIDPIIEETLMRI